MATTGRPREFDEDVVLDGVTRLFWRQGYAATSLQDIVEAVGVQRTSLYGAFGNKRALLLRALERYRALAEETLRTIAAERPVLPALREFLAAPLLPRADPLGWGCLLGRTASELPEDDDEIRGALARGYDVLETGLRQALVGARDAGEITLADPDATVHMIMTVQQGLHVIARTDPHPERMIDAVDATLRQLK